VRVPFLVQLLGALAVGVAIGAVLGPTAAPLGELGGVVIHALKALATPLVFFAVADALVRSEIPPSRGLKLLGICAVNGVFAGTLAVVLSLVVRPGEGPAAEALLAALRAARPAPAEGAVTGATAGAATSVLPPAPKLNLGAALSEIFPESILRPFVENQVLTVVVLALLFGGAVRRLRRSGEGETLAKLLDDGFRVLSITLGWVIRVLPLAILGVVAKVVGQSGLDVFRSLGGLVATVALGLVLHVFVYYALVVRTAGRRSPVVFFRAAFGPMATALTTGSSLATLPVTLKTLEGDLRVSRENARLAACVGTNLNNDGILLYEVGAALFVAQVYGITLGPWGVLKLVATSALAAAGVAGVPEAGLITLSLVLGAVALPTEIVPMLLTVDWMLGRLRAATNVASDLTVACALEGGEKASTVTA
jgi:Na+/H+-dicarboxylate symporter